MCKHYTHVTLRLVKSNTADASERYCVVLASLWFHGRMRSFGVDRKYPIQLPDNTDNGGDEAAGGTKEGNEWIGPVRNHDDEVAGET